MQWLQKLFGEKRKEPNELKVFRFNKMSKIGIVLDDPDSNTMLLARELIKSFKGVQNNIIIHKSGDVKVDNFIGAFEFNKDSFDWKKKPKKNEEILVFLEDEYDLLIDYTQGENPWVDWLITNTTASLKVGRSEKNIYQVCFLSSEDDFETYNQQIKQYLQLINNFEWDEEELNTLLEQA